jgi:hypothetical protein
MMAPFRAKYSGHVCHCVNFCRDAAIRWKLPTKVHFSLNMSKSGLIDMQMIC